MGLSLKLKVLGFRVSDLGLRVQGMRIQGCYRDNGK